VGIREIDRVVVGERVASGLTMMRRARGIDMENWESGILQPVAFHSRVPSPTGNCPKRGDMLVEGLGVYRGG